MELGEVGWLVGRRGNKEKKAAEYPRKLIMQKSRGIMPVGEGHGYCVGLSVVNCTKHTTRHPSCRLGGRKAVIIYIKDSFLSSSFPSCLSFQSTHTYSLFTVLRTSIGRKIGRIERCCTHSHTHSHIWQENAGRIVFLITCHPWKKLP